MCSLLFQENVRDTVSVTQLLLAAGCGPGIHCQGLVTWSSAEASGNLKRLLAVQGLKMAGQQVLQGLLLGPWQTIIAWPTKSQKRSAGPAGVRLKPYLLCLLAMLYFKLAAGPSQSSTTNPVQTFQQVKGGTSGQTASCHSLH